MQNNVYELVSDINARQALMDEKVLTLEERLLIIHEQIDQMPEQIKKVLTSGAVQRSSLPTLVENNITVGGGSHHHNGGSPNNNNITVPMSGYMPSYQRMSDDLQQAKHTYLHPNDAACLSARPSWSTSNINTPLQQAGSSAPTQQQQQQQQYASGGNAAKQYLTPNVLRTTSFDT